MDYNFVTGLIAALAGLVAAMTAFLKELRCWKKPQDGKSTDGNSP